MNIKIKLGNALMLANGGDVCVIITTVMVHYYENVSFPLLVIHKRLFVMTSCYSSFV